jgi:hypothetical protein
MYVRIHMVLACSHAGEVTTQHLERATSRWISETRYSWTTLTSHVRYVLIDNVHHSEKDQTWVFCSQSRL